jgi:peptidoglycan/LPS O-acetylase OafA/YrhL
MPIVKETTMDAKSSYRLEVDGLRALAVIAVILNHFNKNILPSGYLGVDIFFVISGFVITSSLLGRPAVSFGCFLTEFYTRRIKRLAPALVIFVTLTGLLICLFNPSPAASLKTGLTALFGLSNLYLLKQSTDYFAASTELNVFTHTWSLGVEEQFYLVFPFLVWLTRFDHLAANGSRNLLGIIGVLSATSLVGFAFLYQANQPAAYFLMPTRIWELGAGCLLFLGLTHSTRGFLAIQRVPPTLVIAALISVLFIPLQFAIQATVAAVILTVMLIACVRNNTAAYNLLTRPSIIYIGKISYSLYLWHWGVLSLSHWTIGVQWWTAPFQITLMLLLASISYWYVELPLRHAEWSGYRLSAIGYRLSAIGYRLSAIGYRLSAIGYRLRNNCFGQCRSIHESIDKNQPDSLFWTYARPRCSRRSKSNRSLFSECHGN